MRTPARRPREQSGTTIAQMTFHTFYIVSLRATPNKDAGVGGWLVLPARNRAASESYPRQLPLIQTDTRTQWHGRLAGTPNRAHANLSLVQSCWHASCRRWSRSVPPVCSTVPPSVQHGPPLSQARGKGSSDTCATRSSCDARCPVCASEPGSLVRAAHGRGARGLEAVAGRWHPSVR